MKRFLQSVFAIPRMTNETKSAAVPKQPSVTPLLEVRSQVKAGIQVTSWNFGQH
jgi:hypothetical protein